MSKKAWLADDWGCLDLLVGAREFDELQTLALASRYGELTFSRLGFQLLYPRFSAARAIQEVLTILESLYSIFTKV